MIYINPESPIIYLYPRLYLDSYTVVLTDLTIKESIIRLEDRKVVSNERGVVGIDLGDALPDNKLYYISVYDEDNLLIFRGKGSTGAEDINNNDIIRI